MYFITIPKEKGKFKEKLIEVRTDETGWIKTYFDKSTNLEWVEYYPYQEDRAPSILKRADLSDNLEDLINECLSSIEIEGWRGLGAELSSGKYHIKETAQVLKANSYKWSDNALKEFKASFRPIDNRKIVGMKLSEVEKSYLEYLEAKEIIENLIK